MISRILFRAVVGLYPSGARDRLGEEMFELMRRRWDAARARGFGKAALFWLALVKDIVLAVPVAHWWAPTRSGHIGCRGFVANPRRGSGRR